MDGFADERRFRAAWEAVKIVRGVRYSLFTFGQTDLPYYLVLSGINPNEAVSVTQGDVKITRPMIITPDNSPPEFEDFFDNSEDENLAQFIMARTASFTNLKLQNHHGAKRFVSDNVEETVAKLIEKLDHEDEDRVAVLTAPVALAGFAVLRYASERIMQSMPENIQELREKGFLP
jgi:very-short-patch-repair endonuclease